MGKNLLFFRVIEFETSQIRNILGFFSNSKYLFNFSWVSTRLDFSIRIISDFYLLFFCALCICKNMSFFTIVFFFIFRLSNFLFHNFTHVKRSEFRNVLVYAKISRSLLYHVIKGYIVRNNVNKCCFINEPDIWI